MFGFVQPLSVNPQKSHREAFLVFFFFNKTTPTRLSSCQKNNEYCKVLTQE